MFILSLGIYLRLVGQKIIIPVLWVRKQEAEPTDTSPVLFALPCYCM